MLLIKINCMKNVFKRCLSLIILFEKGLENIDANYIKDNIPQYRDLSSSAFHRSFERDKEVLRSIGFVIKYNNDKWELESKYEFTGVNIWNKIKSQNSDESFSFLTTFLYLKDIISLNVSEETIESNQNFVQVQSAIDSKLRISFEYIGNKKIVYPYGFKLYKDIWYLCALDSKTPKTYIMDKISDIKLGDKPHSKELNLESLTTNFSWEDQANNIKAELVINKKAYFIHKNVFVHKLIKYKEEGGYLYLDIETFDSYGLKIFLVLTDEHIKKIDILNKEFERDLISEFSE